MGLIARDKGGREPAPAGTHLAVCFGLIDLGTQTESFQGKTKTAQKIWIWWELSQERTEDDKPVTVGSFYTASLGEKANLRAMLQSWRSRPFTPDELGGFKLRDIIGKPCMLTIIHEPKKSGGVIDRVKGVSNLPKGMPKPALQQQPVVLDLDAFEPAVYEQLPNFLKDMIGKSPEGQKLGLGGKQWPQTPADAWDENGKPIRNGQQPPAGGGVQYESGADPDIPF